MFIYALIRLSILPLYAIFIRLLLTFYKTRGGPRAAATSKMECFAIIVNGFQPLTITTKHSILDVAAVLDPPLKTYQTFFYHSFCIHYSCATCFYCSTYFLYFLYISFVAIIANLLHCKIRFSVVYI